jgi:hypothetical protein
MHKLGTRARPHTHTHAHARAFARAAGGLQSMVARHAIGQKDERGVEWT